MTRTFDVLIAGYYGFGNLGDELLLETCIACLVENGVPKERIAVLSATPEETSKRHGVRAFDRWRVGQILHAAKKSRSLLLGGGGLFQDTTSVKSCFYYWFVVKLARLMGAKVWMAGQSIGPLTTGMGMFLTKNAFSSCAFVGVRDHRSAQQLQEWGIPSRCTPDLVLRLRLARDEKKSSNVLLLNVRPWEDDTATRTATCAQKTAEKYGWMVKGVALSPEDAALLQSLYEKKIVNLHEIALVKSLKDFENISSGAVASVGMRLHFLVLSLLAGLPLCAAPYDPKVDSLRMAYNIPVVDGNGAELTFSDPSHGGAIGDCAGEIDRMFQDGLRAVLGEAR